jgi:outer membrane protein, adhesin transport system
MANRGSAPWSPGSRTRRGSLPSLGLLCGLLATSDVALATSIEDSIQAALATNPDIGVVAADRDAIDQELRQARAEYLPSIDLRGAAGPEWTDSPATRNRRGRGRDAGDSQTLLRLESQLTLTQMLFDGFATQSEVQRQTARIDSAAYRVQETAEFVGLDAVEAHLDVLRNQELVELARDNLAQHQRILGQVALLERQGAGSIGDVRQAESRLADAESSLALATGNLRDAAAFYQAVVGLPPADLEDAVPPVAALPESEEASAAVASGTNPTVLIANADVDVAKAELRGSRAGYYPNLDIELGASAGEDLDGVEGSDVSAQALLVLRYNLFRGGGDIAREREAFSRLEEARQAVRVAQRDAKEEARVAFNALTTARARVAALSQGVEAQRATRDIYAQQFDLGQRGLLDLLDAENELFNGRSNLVTADFTEIFAAYRVLAIIGTLLDTLSIDRPKEAISIYRQRREPVRENATVGVAD